MKQITLKILTDGKVQAETHGIKGKACMDYISIIEELTAAQTVNSEFTSEYREIEEDLQIETDAEVQI